MSNGQRVLVVDDEAEVREVMSRQLTRLGCVCATAGNGREALALMRRDDFDIAFIDLVMPEMDGLALLGAMNEANVDTTAIVASGKGNITQAVEAMKRGAFDYIEKDFDVQVLQATVERVSQHRRLRRRAAEMEVVAQQWEATFNAVPDLVAVMDSEGRFVQVNKAMGDRLGIPPEEVVGAPCHVCLQGSESPPVSCPRIEARKDKGLQPLVCKLRDEHLAGHFLATTSPFYDEDGECIGSVYVARDITEEERAQKELRRAHMETERLVSSMSSLLIEVDMELRVRRWNAAAESTLGVSAQEVLGKPFADSGIRWDWDWISEELAGWFTSGEPIRLPEFRYERPDGVEGVLGLTMNPIRNDAGESMGFFLMGTDITKRRVLEAQLVQAQKLESIGQLAAGIAHEINTPTQFVGDNIEFLEYAFENLEKVRAACHRLLESAKQGVLEDSVVSETSAAVDEVNVDYLIKQIPRAIKQSLEGVGRIASIVKAMKEFSHPGTGKKTRVDLNAAIDSTITVSRNEWKYVADMTTDFEPGLEPVACLPGEFNQVILNIIVNAAHAIAHALGDGSENKGTITVQTRRDGEWVEIRIGDTGSGIPEEVRGRIFDPFFTTKEVGRGTGQGLAIAHNVIVEKHGGTLTFETDMGKGTTFIIRIPISEE